MNIKILHGRLARDPEYVKNDDEKRSYCKFTVATDRRYGDESDFHDCIIFGKRAAVIDKYFFKGSEIVCFGEEQFESYEGRDGVKRKSSTLFVAEFDFCGSKNDSSKGKNEPRKDTNDSWQKQEEDIPF